ncbi:MAG: acyl-CoA dehydrogenase family protein [Myxococcota bacterium]|jgi:alkylation response protein AidB-like acyl-CoA dehydrogenase|nr:acyl-CoA dehydrogenase family protein [Myxococcota bacterium]
MYIGYNEEQEALRKELRAYYDDLLTPGIREALHEGQGVGPAMRSVVRQMGKDGWLGIGWPKEFGGQGRSAVEQFIFFDESMRAGAPVPMLTINTVGPTLYSNGTEEQKQFFLPKILQGEMHFCVGYTEPNAGTDLASLTTRADADGDEFVINGQKVFTSLASDSDYIWLAARTDQDAPKHAGLSMFLVDMNTPGIKAEPMDLLSSHNICTTFFDNVRVPKTALVGELNKGWKLITGQLNHERVAICSPGMLEATYVKVLDWARETKLTDGRRVIDQEWAQVNLARVHTGLEFLRLANWKVAWQGTQGEVSVADASSIKVFGTEWYLESLRLMMEVVGQRAYLRPGSPEAVVAGQIERLYRSLLILTFGGGTNEIQRDLIGLFGLGLPRVPRF